jgi:hypothetical protein
MQDDRVGTASGDAPAPPTAVSPNNPCPFLRALVAGDFIDGHIVPLSTLSKTIETATGTKGLKGRLAGLKTYLVALVANGLSPLRLLRSWWSGAEPDALRDGPLDKHGSGSRILDTTGQVNEEELARLARFGKDQPNMAGGFEPGLTSQDITAYMDENFDRAKGARRWIDRRLMNSEWPVLLDIMGKGDGDQRYLSVAEVGTLFNKRRLPDRVVRRLTSQPAPAPAGGPLRVLVKIALAAVALVFAAIVAIAEFPDQVRMILPTVLAQLLPPPLPDRAPTTAAHWLDQNWSTEDRHWFHHASQGTATFPVQYAWFIALEQPRIHLFTQPGLLSDSHYLERFGFLPSPRTVHTDEASLRRFGYANSPDAKTEPAPAPISGLRPAPVENFDGLPVGFARLTGVDNPATGHHEPDRIGLTCAACHTGHISYKGISVRFDGGPGMLDLGKLESATGLSIIYTLYVPGRFERFARRVLGPDASKADRSKLKKELAARGDYVLNQKNVLEKTLAAKGQKDTEEGFGRLDALNRIGNQVFYTDLADGGLTGFERNLHARDAPVSFPPIWTVPWFLWAQYDASIQQPLIRNAGEALGVFALLNLSPDYPPETLFRSSVAIDTLARIEAMVAGPDPFSRKSFGGLLSPKWPSQIFPDDPAWNIDPARVSKGRAIYAEICAECHLGPVDDAVFDTQFPGQSIWSAGRWKGTDGPNPDHALELVQKGGMGTDLAQANVLASRKVDVPSFLKIEPADDLNCPDSHIARATSTEMSFSLALMSLVDRVSTKWMKDHPASKPDREMIWGSRQNCPNPVSEYRARPLNGVWATAPYLHNGSVPSLYWLLKPAAERPKQFCIGARDFDPEQVGYRVVAGAASNYRVIEGLAPSCNKGETLFSATKPDGSAMPGNSVLGHSLEGKPGPDKPGVIGRALSDEERKDLIEYLKTL